MSIVLRPSISSREAILLYGSYGTGKSNAVLSVAWKVEGEFHIVDTDYSYDRLLETEYTDLADRVHLYYVDDQDWKDQLAVAEKARAQCGDDDWFSYDSTTPTWDACQAWFTEQVYGKDEAQWFLEARQEKEKTGSKNPVSRINDDKWTVINAQFKKLHKVFMPGAQPGIDTKRYRGHMILTAESTKTSSEFDDKNTKAMFGAFGYKPKGQKRVPQIVHTVLMLNKLRSGGYEATSIKDRGNREEFEELEVGPDFAGLVLEEDREVEAKPRMKVERETVKKPDLLVHLSNREAENLVYYLHEIRESKAHKHTPIVNRTCVESLYHSLQRVLAGSVSINTNYQTDADGNVRIEHD